MAVTALALPATAAVVDTTPAAALAATYANPTGSAPARQLSNPGVLKDGSTFYAYGSAATFASPALTSNLPIRTSTDLATWSTPIDGGLSAAWASSSPNVSSPSPAKIGTTYVVYFTATLGGTSSTRCIGVATSVSPTGPFVDSSAAPLLCPGTGARDPSIVLGSGNPQLVFYGAGAGGASGNGIYAQRLTSSGLGLSGSPAFLRGTADSDWYSGQLDRPAVVVSAGTAYLFVGGYTRAHTGHSVGWSRCESANPITNCRSQKTTGPIITSTESVRSPGGFQPFVDGSSTWIAYDALAPSDCPTGTCSSAPASARTLRIDKLCIGVDGVRSNAPSTGSVSTNRSATCAADAPMWVATTAAATIPVTPVAAAPFTGGLDDDTIRQGLHSTVGGDAVRVTISNANGGSDLVVAHASIGVNTVASGDNLNIQAGTRKDLTFSGLVGITIPAGKSRTSDVVALPLPRNADFAVSLHTMGGPSTWTGVRYGGQSVWKAPGDRASAANSGGGFVLADDGQYFVSAVDVLDTGVEIDATHRVEGGVALIGDSKANGGGGAAYGIDLDLPVDQQKRWTDRLSDRIFAYPKDIAVVNVASAGNNLLAGAPTDEAAVDRFARDVLGRAGLRTAIVSIGTNDLYRVLGTSTDLTTAQATALRDQMKVGYQSLINQAHADGIRIIGTTIIPLGGPQGAGCTTGPYPPTNMRWVRNQINAWILGYVGPGKFDAVQDIADWVDDDADPERVRCGYQTATTAHLDKEGHFRIGTDFDIGGASGLMPPP